MSTSPLQLAIVYPGDGETRRLATPENNRHAPLFALQVLGLAWFVLSEAGNARAHLMLRALRTLSPVVADWRSLIDALRPHLQSFWHGMPTPQRASFLRHLRSYWEVARHRIAPQLAQELQALQDSGQLQIRAGRLLRARRGDDAVEALIRERGGNTLRNERYDLLIRATGLDTDVERSTHPLIAHLRESGLVAADPLGLGLKTSDRFEILDAKGGAVRGLFAIGPLLRAQLWEITAVPELRKAARDLATQLLATSAAARVAPREQAAIA